MLPVVTPEEMRQIDNAAHESEEVLIERAGYAIAAEALRMMGGGYGRPGYGQLGVVFCPPEAGLPTLCRSGGGGGGGHPAAIIPALVWYFLSEISAGYWRPGVVF